MPPDRHSDNPDEWIEFAGDDLAAALAPGVRPEYRCYHAQQAAEKALKALVLARGMQFKRIHSLAALLDDLKADGVDIPAEVEKVRDLDPFGVDARYPMRGKFSGKFNPDEAVEKARIALEWAKRQVAQAQSNR